MPNTTAPNIGYGPRYTVKTFNGDANDYDCWEDGFLGTLRLLGLHFAMDKYSSTRPATFNVAEAKQTIYDYLSNCLDRTSHGLIKREAPGDGVAALTAGGWHAVGTDSMIPSDSSSLLPMDHHGAF